MGTPLFLAVKPDENDTKTTMTIHMSQDCASVLCSNAGESFSPFTGEKMNRQDVGETVYDSAYVQAEMIQIGKCEAGCKCVQLAHKEDVANLISSDTKTLHCVACGTQYPVDISVEQYITKDTAMDDDLMGDEIENEEDSESVGSETEDSEDTVSTEEDENLDSEDTVEGDVSDDESEDEMSDDESDESEDGVSEDEEMSDDSESEDDSDEAEYTDITADIMAEEGIDYSEDGEGDEDTLDEISEAALKAALADIEEEEIQPDVSMLTGDEEGVAFRLDANILKDKANLECVLDEKSSKYFVFANSTPIGILDRAAAHKDNASVFDKPAFIKGFTMQFAADRDVSRFGYKPFGVRVDVSKHVETAFSKKETEIKDTASAEFNSKIDVLKSTLGTVALASNKGMLDNPLRDKLVSRLDAAGFEGAGDLVNRVFMEDSASYINSLISEGVLLADKSEAVRAEYERLVHKTSYPSASYLGTGGRLVADTASTVTKKVVSNTIDTATKSNPSPRKVDWKKTNLGLKF